HNEVDRSLPRSNKCSFTIDLSQYLTSKQL
ncbi:unnamed protein product, partial [Adineta steineri]